MKNASDLLQINGGIFVDQGKSIGEFGNENAKILVVGNPANTNALIGRKAANNSSQIWMAMTMLDSNRAKSMLAKKLSCNVSEIKKMIIWGNHSPTMYPDFENALKDNQSVANLIEDTNWIDSHFIPNVQQRGKAVIDARGPLQQLLLQRLHLILLLLVKMKLHRMIALVQQFTAMEHMMYLKELCADFL